jgi:ComF family protein
MPRWLRVLRDLVFPACCEVCDGPVPLGGPSCICDLCREAMAPPTPPLCEACGVPLAGPEAADLCRPCSTRRPAFAAARAAALYRAGPAGPAPLATAVQRLKYARRRGIARALGDLLAERYPFAADAVLVPVPLHPSRLRARGFNQAVLLARVLARSRGLALHVDALVRTRATAGQPGLAAGARRENLSGAFRVRTPASLRDRTVVLVDDVLTTGATADACARALAAAGAARVDVYVVGRAP